mgnify:CR=1 FL=1
MEISKELINVNNIFKNSAIETMITTEIGKDNKTIKFDTNELGLLFLENCDLINMCDKYCIDKHNISSLLLKKLLSINPEIKKYIPIKILDELLIDYIDEHNNTYLMQKIINKDNNIIEFINKNEEKCNPEHINNNCNTALLLACNNNLEHVAILLIEKFGELCKPEYIDNDGYTALIWACKNKLEKVAILLIEKFGDLCNPECKTNNTALKLANQNNLINVEKLLIEKFKT